MLGCDAGHRLDVNRKGYLSAIDPARGVAGDSAAILEARARFLARGHYQPIADAVAASLPLTASLSILDSGAGTGYYLADLLSRLPTPHDALATDASAAAVRMSVAATGSAGLVADVWAAWAVRDSRADALICVFAPRNPAEFARVLRADGTLVVVTPAPAHLAELRSAGLVMGMQAGKRERLLGSLEPWFELRHRTELDFAIDLEPDAARDLTAMGPSGHHSYPGSWTGGRVTVAVECSSFGRRRG